MNLKPWDAPYCPETGDSDPRMAFVWCFLMLMVCAGAGVVVVIVYMVR